MKGRECLSPMISVRIRFGLIILLSFLSLFSCTSFYPNRTPEWIWVAPMDSKNVLYAVGGPSVTLEEARNLAMKTISSYVNTEVSSYYGSYSSAYFDEITRTIAEKNSSWISSKSSSIIVGLQEIERWFDKTEDKWWVLLRIEKTDFEKSIRATAEEVIRKREKVEKNSSLAVTIIEQLLHDFSKYNFQERLYSSLECYQTISSFEFSDLLTGEINGSLRRLLLFVESLIYEIIATIDLTIDNQPILMYLNTENVITGSIVTENDIDFGNLVWNVIGEDEAILTSFKTNSNGEFSISIPGSTLSIVNTHIAFTPELSMFEKSLIGMFNMKIFTIPITIYQGKFGFRVMLDHDESREFYKDIILAIVHEQLGFSCIEQSEFYPMLIFNISQKITDQNQFLAAAQTLITVECQYADGAKRAFKVPLGKGFGATSAKAIEESFINSVEFLRTSESFLQFLSAIR